MSLWPEAFLGYARFLRSWIRDAVEQARRDSSADQDVMAKLEAAADSGVQYDVLKTVIRPHQIRSEILGFLRLAQSRPHAVIGEIGLGEGGTHALLSRSIPGIRKLIGVDLFVRNRKPLSRLVRPGVEHLLIHGNSTGPKTLSRVKKFLGPDLFDVLFIDGDHAYEGVKRDYEIYRSLVREGGLIAFHDIVPDHQRRFGRATGTWTGGVPDFWQEVKSGKESWEFIEHPEQDGFGIGVFAHRPGASV